MGRSWKDAGVITIGRCEGVSEAKMSRMGEQAISNFFYEENRANRKRYLSRNIFNPPSAETKVDRLFPARPASRVVVTSTISETHGTMNRFNVGKVDDVTMARRRGY